MSEKNLNNKNLPYDLMLLLKVMPTNFSQEDNAIFYHQKSLRELLDFRTEIYIFTCMQVLFL